MKYSKIKYGLILFFTWILGCVEPFTPQVSNYQDLLVVEAFISDDIKSQEVILTRSFPIDTSRVNYETGANILLEVDGSQLFFTEKEQGHYTPETAFVPEEGKSYILSITTRNGEVYNSNSVVMKKTPPISDVYYERKTLPSDKANGLDEGFQIYLDAEIESGLPGYYMYEWEETWEFATPFFSFLDYNFDTQEEFLREENISRCWQESFSTGLNLATTENLSYSNIEKQPIRFVSFGESVLREKYSILVKQFSLSEEGFRFWENLKESNESTGSLYDAQPFQVTGNIENVNNPEEPVLGYFDMATVSSKRIFISSLEDVPSDIDIPTLYPACRSADTLVSFGNVEAFLGIGYLIERYSAPPRSGFFMVIKSCIDCRLKGTNVEPEFWE